MKKLMKFVSVAACIAAVSPGLAAQGDGTSKVRVMRAPTPVAHPPVAKQLAEVIDLLDADGMTEAQQQKAKAVLKGVVEQLQHDQKEGSFGGSWTTAPEIAVVGEPEISIVEVEGDDMAPAQAPRATVRTRVLRLGGDGDGPAVARVIHGGEWMPKGAPKAAKGVGIARGQGGAFVIRKSDDGDDDEVWESIEGDVAQAKQDAQRAVHEQRLARGEMAEAHRELQLQLGRKRDRLARRSMLALTGEAAAPAAAESVDEVDLRAAANADRAIKVLVERKRAAGKQRRAEAAKVEDVTEEVEVSDADDADDADLRAMIDQMRAEMREVRALMERIRDQGPATDAK